MTVCPICKSEAKSILPTGDFYVFDCPEHGIFKVAGTVCSVDTCKNASREKWEAALKKAKARTEPGEWPLIDYTDF
jgi:hypothetical protein